MRREKRVPRRVQNKQSSFYVFLNKYEGTEMRDQRFNLNNLQSQVLANLDDWDIWEASEESGKWERWHREYQELELCPRHSSFFEATSDF